MANITYPLHQKPAHTLMHTSTLTSSQPCKHTFDPLITIT